MAIRFLDVLVNIAGHLQKRKQLSPIGMATREGNFMGAHNGSTVETKEVVGGGGGGYPAPTVAHE